jgi:Fe2+ or Zn2+ uptake regulation protein
MNNKFDDKLQAQNIKLTAMRQLVLEVLTEEKNSN